MLDLWIVGDEFIKEVEPALIVQQKAGQSRAANMPFMFKLFNVKTYTPKFATRGLAKFTNTLISGLNDWDRLLKYILVIPDKDFLTVLNGNHSALADRT